MKHTVLFAALLLSGCHGRQVKLDPYDKMLLAVADDNAHVPDLALIKSSFQRAVEHYATVDPRARQVSINDAMISRMARVDYPSGSAPRACCGSEENNYVQGWFLPPMIIRYAHERAIYCEALHFIAYRLGDPGWGVTGHDEEGDKLHFPCWQVIETEYKEAHP